MTFDRILVAKHSVRNKCFVKDGEVLFFRPRKTLPMKVVIQHHFVGTKNLSAKSKYGWVAPSEPISEEEFANIHLNMPADFVQLEAIRDMLGAIASLPFNTPVLIQYVQRGVEKKVMELSIHKVFFFRTAN